MPGMMNYKMIDWGLPEHESSIIKIIGVGGGGGNAVNYMYNSGIKGVDFIICNTDNQHLLQSPIPRKIQIGYSMTSGRGVGGNPEMGRRAAQDSIIQVREAIESKTKMLFIATGMGGGTGTGAAPVIAKMAKEMDLLTVGIVTYPFDHEGPLRKQVADAGIEEMKKYVDALIVIYNQRLMDTHLRLPFTKAFAFVDNVCATAARGIAEIITVSGQMNLDFDDVNAIMKNCGTAMFGSAVGEGEGRALKAIRAALHSPLLKDKDIRGAQNILLNLSYGTHEILLEEIKIITEYIRKEVGREVNIKLGYCQDERLGDKLSITIIATYINEIVRPTEPKPETNRIIYTLNTNKTIEYVQPVTDISIVEKPAMARQEVVAEKVELTFRKETPIPEKQAEEIELKESPKFQIPFLKFLKKQREKLLEFLKDGQEDYKK